MYLQDPTKPFKGQPKDNADSIPVKLVVAIKDGDDRYNLQFPMHTNKDQGITFSGMKALAQVFSTVYHSFTAAEKGLSDEIRFSAGLTDGKDGGNQQPWVASGYKTGEVNEKGYPVYQRIERAYGVKADGNLDLGIEKGEIDGRKIYEAAEGFVGVYPNSGVPANLRGKQYVDFDKVIALVNEMLSPYDAARAERNRSGQSHSAHEAGIDPEGVAEAHETLRQRG